MNFIETEIKGVWIIEPKIWGDSRGYFIETFKQELFN
jgi:dTDP-4-dehydrorhamnose 3,5-epimerase